MKTLNQFKLENSIEKIDLLQGIGRKYASIRDLQLVVSSKCDLTKPLFVTELNTTSEDGVLSRVPNGYLLVNSTVTVTDTI